MQRHQIYGYLFLASFCGFLYLWWTQQYYKYDTIGAGFLSLFFLRLMCNGGVNPYFPDLSSKTVVITGGNSGIGFAAAKEIAKLNPKALILACRNKTRGEKAVDLVRKDLKHGGKNVEFMQLDLGDLKSVRNFATNFKEKHQQLDILLNNAGLGSFERTLTAQGYELVFGVCHLGHFLLTKLLMPCLKRSSDGRVVVVSSDAHKRFKKMKFDNLMLEKEYNHDTAYGSAKLANVLFAKQLSISLKEEGCNNVKSCSLHPGVICTNICNQFFTQLTGLKKIAFYLLLVIGYPFYIFCFKTAWQGAQTSLYCCLCPFEELVSGQFYADCLEFPGTLDSHWKEDALRLWNVSEELVKDFVDEKQSNKKLQ